MCIILLQGIVALTALERQHSRERERESKNEWVCVQARVCMYMCVLVYLFMGAFIITFLA